jgi:hypothetical protein
MEVDEKKKGTDQEEERKTDIVHAMFELCKGENECYSSDSGHVQTPSNWCARGGCCPLR